MSSRSALVTGSTKDGDPRITGDYFHRLSGREAAADVVLVGVVHDHPASTYRVRTVVEDVEPDVLALELPPLSVPLFERYAEDGRAPPAFGGEMSAAIQAADGAEVAGIDGPSLGFLVRLLRTLYRDGASPADVRSIATSLGSVSRHTVVCRFAAVLAARTTIRLEVDSPVAHDCGWRDDPRTQARDERRQIRRAEAVANTFGLTDAVRYRKSTREKHMADRLSTLRRKGTVVAVVGIDHLDPLIEYLGETNGTQ